VSVEREHRPFVAVLASPIGVCEDDVAVLRAQGVDDSVCFASELMIISASSTRVGHSIRDATPSSV
jgi:hypothetical protein